MQTGGGNKLINIYDGIEEFLNFHTCVTEGITVKNHTIKEPLLLPYTIYIRTPLVGETISIYLHPSIPIHEVSEDFTRSLLYQEQTVDTWYYFLVCLPVIDKESKNRIKLVTSINQSTLRKNILTPHKK